MSEEMKNESDRGEEEEGNEMDEIGTCLTPAAVAGLYEFHQEQRRIREAGDDGEERRATLLENDLAKFFPEDWQISQFWYDDPTTTVFSQEILRLMEEDEESRVAFLSCPSVFRHCFNPTTPHKVDLFEFDRRFSAYGSCFHFYDYNSPDVIPVESVGLYSILMLDPPFLSLDCLTKMGKTVQLLAKPGAKVILCTAGIMEEGAKETLGLERRDFIPKHRNSAGVQLRNQFACFTNYPFRKESPHKT